MDFCLLILIAVAVWFLKMTYFLPWRHVGMPALIAGTHCRASRTPAGGGWWLWWQCGALSCDWRGDMFHPGGWPVDPEVCFSDVWSFDPENLRWTQKFGSWMLRFFGRFRRHLNRMFLPVRCYITVTLFEIWLLAEISHHVFKVDKDSSGKVAIFVPRSSDPRPWKERQGLFFHMNQLGFFPCVWRLVHALVRPQRYLCGWPYVYVWWLPGNGAWVSRGKNSHCAKCQLDSYFWTGSKYGWKQHETNMCIQSWNLQLQSLGYQNGKPFFGSWNGPGKCWLLQRCLCAGHHGAMPRAVWRSWNLRRWALLPMHSVRSSSDVAMLL